MLRSALAYAKFFWFRRAHGFDAPTATPCMDELGLSRFRRELSGVASYTEYGSGGSTVLADALGIATVSVESDPLYARSVASQLRSNCVTQVVPEMGLIGEWGTPLFKTKRKGRRYATAPLAYATPQFVLVDGRYRVACALTMAQHLFDKDARAVLMFDDYVGRPFYHAVETFLGKPEIAGRSALFEIGNSAITPGVIAEFLSDAR